jgi:hypothetical protein
MFTAGKLLYHTPIDNDKEKERQRQRELFAMGLVIKYIQGSSVQILSHEDEAVCQRHILNKLLYES